MGYGFKIMVSGDYACFTRPDLSDPLMFLSYEIKKGREE